jgi:hypothetical protein
MLCTTLGRIYFSFWIWLIAGLLLTTTGLRLLLTKKPR